MACECHHYNKERVDRLCEIKTNAQNAHEVLREKIEILRRKVRDGIISEMNRN